MLGGPYPAGLETRLASASLLHGGSFPAALLAWVLEHHEKLFGAIFCPHSCLPFLSVRGSHLGLTTLAIKLQEPLKGFFQNKTKQNTPS